MRASRLAATHGRPHWSQEHHPSTLRTSRIHNSVDNRQQSGHRVRKVRLAPRMSQLLLEAKLAIAGGAYGRCLRVKTSSPGHQPFQTMTYRLKYPLRRSRGPPRTRPGSCGDALRRDQHVIEALAAERSHERSAYECCRGITMSRVTARQVNRFPKSENLVQSVHVCHLTAQPWKSYVEGGHHQRVGSSRNANSDGRDEARQQGAGYGAMPSSSSLTSAFFADTGLSASIGARVS
jgi:hypothetical protein